MPLLWLSLAFLIGILMGERLGGSPAAWLWLAAAALGVEFLWRLANFLGKPVKILESITSFVSRIHASFPGWLRAPIPYSLILCCLFLGGARFTFSLPTIDPTHIAWYNDLGYPVVIEGLITAPPEERDEYTLLWLEVEQLHPAGELLFTTVTGKLGARIPPGQDFRYGDRVRLEGILKTPSENEGFSYRQYLARQDIYSILSCGRDATQLGNECARRLGRDQGSPLLARVFNWRRRSLDGLYRLFPDPEASLLAGILLGIEGGIPQDVMEAFQATGTAHIIVISGFNFAIIAGLFTEYFGRLLGRWRGMLAALLAIGLYTIFVGGGAAVVRAAIMGGFAVFARQVGRRQNGINSLAFVGALMSLGNPHVLWDVGFQLSFAATLGLVLYADPLAQYFIKRAAQRLPLETAQKLAGPVGEYFLYTLAAQVMTLPVMLYHFQRLSIISFFANPLILPVQPPLMLMGGLALIAGLFFKPLGQLLATLTWPLVVYTVRAVEWLAQSPFADRSIGTVSLVSVALFYAILLGWTYASERTRTRVKNFFGQSPSFAVAVLATILLLAVVVWRLALESPDGRLHLTMLDVGSGEAFLIQTPEGRYLLINGGSSASRLSNALGRRLPLEARQLDYLVVAGTGDEQLDALAGTIDRFPPAEVLWSGTRIGEYSTRLLLEELNKARIPTVQALPGHSLDLGQGAHLDVLATGGKGAVLWLEWGSFRVLLPVGMSFEIMEELQADPSLGPVTALLLADGGIAALNTAEWIDHWQPQTLLLSVKAGDDQGLPHAETLEAITGYNLLRTDANGWIKLSTDGDQMWVEVEKR